MFYKSNLPHILYFFTFLTLTLCEHYWVKTDDESYLVEIEENGGVGINANDREDGTDYKDQSLEKIPFYLGIFDEILPPILKACILILFEGMICTHFD